MILFEDWNIRADEQLLARQFDNRSRTLTVTGNLPEGWNWVMIVQVGKYMDYLQLEPVQGGIGTCLTAGQLALSGHYTLQLRGTRADEVKHTNTIVTYIPSSLSGDAHWPTVPQEFSRLEQRVQSFAQHPPTIGEDGHWYIWSGTEYERTHHSAVEQILAALPNGDEVEY